MTEEDWYGEGILTLAFLDLWKRMSELSADDIKLPLSDHLDDGCSYAEYRATIERLMKERGLK